MAILVGRWPTRVMYSVVNAPWQLHVLAMLLRSTKQRNPWTGVAHSRTSFYTPFLRYLTVRNSGYDDHPNLVPSESLPPTFSGLESSRRSIGLEQPPIRRSQKMSAHRCPLPRRVWWWGKKKINLAIWQSRKSNEEKQWHCN